MKNNREFLDGIYEKAKILEENKVRRNIQFKKCLKYSSIAALIMLIPFLTSRGNTLNLPRPWESNDGIPKEIRMLNLDPTNYFIEADYIVIGKVGDNYNMKESTASIRVQESLLGPINGSINLKISRDEVKDLRKARQVLFLHKDDENTFSLLDPNSFFKEVQKNVFQDSLGNQYKLQDIKENIKERN